MRGITYTVYNVNPIFLAPLEYLKREINYSSNPQRIFLYLESFLNIAENFKILTVRGYIIIMVCDLWGKFYVFFEDVIVTIGRHCITDLHKNFSHYRIQPIHKDMINRGSIEDAEYWFCRIGIFLVLSNMKKTYIGFVESDEAEYWGAVFYNCYIILYIIYIRFIRSGISGAFDWIWLRILFLG